MRPLWHREACWECGTEGLATRTIATPRSEPYICDGCETFDHGYKEGVGLAISPEAHKAASSQRYLQGQRDMLAKVLREMRSWSDASFKSAEHASDPDYISARNMEAYDLRDTARVLAAELRPGKVGDHG